MSETYLLHATAKHHLASILKEGLREVSYWAEEGSVSEYYEESVSDEGGEPLSLRLPLSVLEQYAPEPDHPGLEEPLTYTLKMSEEEVWEEWEETDKSWQASLELISSIRCRAPIPACVVLQYNPQLLPTTNRSPRP